MKIKLEMPDELVDAMGRTWEPTGEVSPPCGRTCAVRAFGQQDWHWEVDHDSENPLPNPILRLKRWTPKIGEAYLFVTPTGEVMLSCNRYAPIDREKMEVGNCYKPDSDEAKAAAERVKVAYKNETQPSQSGKLNQQQRELFTACKDILQSSALKNHHSVNGFRIKEVATGILETLARDEKNKEK